MKRMLIAKWEKGRWNQLVFIFSLSFQIIKSQPKGDNISKKKKKEEIWGGVKVKKKITMYHKKS